LVDGFFTFWATLVLWLFWENLQAPRDWRWLVGYIVALALLVLTKENSFFVWVALVALLITNRWLQFGPAARALVVATVLGLALGYLAFSEILGRASFRRPFQPATITGAVVLLAAIEFHQYILLAVRFPLYELITHDLLQALSILK